MQDSETSVLPHATLNNEEFMACNVFGRRSILYQQRTSATFSDGEISVPAASTKSARNVDVCGS